MRRTHELLKRVTELWPPPGHGYHAFTLSTTGLGGVLILHLHMPDGWATIRFLDDELDAPVDKLVDEVRAILGSRPS